jgi:hypothetical protein
MNAAQDRSLRNNRTDFAAPVIPRMAAMGGNAPNMTAERYWGLLKFRQISNQNILLEGLKVTPKPA